MIATKYRFMLLVACFVIGSSAMVSADTDWTLRKDKDNIQVYTRNVEGSSHDAVRAVTVLNDVTLNSLVALIEDVEACKDWADRCSESYVFKRLSDTEAFVYTHNAMPFPVKDRDVLAHVTWVQDPTTYEVVMNSKATTGMLDAVKGRLRLTKAEASWRFKPLASGGIEVSNEAHIDPGSSLPGWITNLLLVDTPYETMRSFVAEVAKSKYREASIDFIKEPSTKIKLESAQRNN